jgi:hypothetical protein
LGTVDDATEDVEGQDAWSPKCCKVAVALAQSAPMTEVGIVTGSGPSDIVASTVAPSLTDVPVATDCVAMRPLATELEKEWPVIFRVMLYGESALRASA